MQESFRVFAQRVPDVVFLIQNTQNHDSKAMQLTLDELIRATAQARNRLIHLELLSVAQLATLESEFQRVRGSRRAVPGVADQKAAAQGGASAAQ